MGKQDQGSLQSHELQRPAGTKCDIWHNPLLRHDHIYLSIKPVKSMSDYDHGMSLDLFVYFL